MPERFHEIVSVASKLREKYASLKPQERREFILHLVRIGRRHHAEEVEAGEEFDPQAAACNSRETFLNYFGGPQNENEKESTEKIRKMTGVDFFKLKEKGIRLNTEVLTAEELEHLNYLGNWHDRLLDKHQLPSWGQTLLSPPETIREHLELRILHGIIGDGEAIRQAFVFKVPSASFTFHLDRNIFDFFSVRLDLAKKDKIQKLVDKYSEVGLFFPGRWVGCATVRGGACFMNVYDGFKDKKFLKALEEVMLHKHEE